MATEEQCLELGPGGVPKGSKTHEYYRTFNIPERFDNPEWFEYGDKKIHPLYRTTAQDYGQKPNVHTMQTQFHGKTQKFTNHLRQGGMYKNHSLNTAKDISYVPSYAQ